MDTGAGCYNPAIMIETPAKTLKFIGCEIIYREACLLASRSEYRIDVEFLHKGLHDLETPDMRARLQQAIDAANADGLYEAILLGYARCNDGLVGVTARDVPLVIPRAHDCITFFFGSRAAYKKYFDERPGTYYLTTGWSERNTAPDGYDQPAYGQQGVMGKLGLTESYDEMVSKYGRENADFIRETMGDWMKNYSHMLYLKMGACDEGPLIAEARARAERNGWSFEQRDGDWTLLEKLFNGDWDDDFAIVPPGGRIVARNDETVLDVEK